MTEANVHEQLTFGAGYADLARGVMTAPLEAFGDIDPEKRITLVRLATEHGLVYGQADIESTETDTELQVSKSDYQNARPDFIRQGLYIDMTDPRYRDKQTEQLLWAWGPVPIDSQAVRDLKLERRGVVVPPDEFKIIAHSPGRIVKFSEATTRNANKNELDRKEVDEKVGRSAAHSMESKLASMSTLEANIHDEIALLRKPYHEASSTWRAHFKAKNLDKVRRETDERIHEMVEVATLNLNPGTFELRALHRAIAKRLYRNPTPAETASQWRIYTSLAGQYATARLVKVIQSQVKAKKQLDLYQPYLDRAAESQNELQDAA